MITDAQVRRLMRLNQSEDTLSLAAAKAGMDEKTARKYRQVGRLPSQLRVEHTGSIRVAFRTANCAPCSDGSRCGVP